AAGQALVGLGQAALAAAGGVEAGAVGELAADPAGGVVDGDRVDLAGVNQLDELGVGQAAAVVVAEQRRHGEHGDERADCDPRPPAAPAEGAARRAFPVGTTVETRALAVAIVAGGGRRRPAAPR